MAPPAFAQDTPAVLAVESLGIGLSVPGVDLTGELRVHRFVPALSVRDWPVLGVHCYGPARRSQTNHLGVALLRSALLQQAAVAVVPLPGATLTFDALGFCTVHGVGPRRAPSASRRVNLDIGDFTDAQARQMERLVARNLTHVALPWDAPGSDGDVPPVRVTSHPRALRALLEDLATDTYVHRPRPRSQRPAARSRTSSGVSTYLNVQSNLSVGQIRATMDEIRASSGYREAVSQHATYGSASSSMTYGTSTYASPAYATYSTSTNLVPAYTVTYTIS